MQSVAYDRQHLVGSLKGQKMHVPNFEKVFAGWETAFNPHLETLRLSVNDRLKCIVEQQYTHKSESALALKKLQAPNYALLGAYWWPYVDERMLHTMTYMAIWIALWDDVFEVEAPSLDAGALAKDWEQAQSYRYQTLLFIRQSLNLPCGSYQRRPDNILITSFEDIASHVNSVCTDDQKQRLYTQLKEHIISTAERQRLRLSPTLPTVKSYLDVRMGTSGVQTCATLLEICQDPSLPASIATNPKVATLLDQINIIILVTNDLCSLKSKLARGSVDNLIALLRGSHADLDSAVAVATGVLEAAKGDFDTTSAELLRMAGDGYFPDDRVEGLVRACRAACMGNLVWSLSTRRYDIHLDGRKRSRTIVL